jgi:hypothetical protein
LNKARQDAVKTLTGDFRASLSELTVLMDRLRAKKNTRS